MICLKIPVRYTALPYESSSLSRRDRGSPPGRASRRCLSGYPPPPDAGLYTQYNVSISRAYLYWATCGTIGSTTKCYDSGTVHDFNRAAPSSWACRAWTGIA